MISCALLMHCFPTMITASCCTTLLVPEVANDMFVVAWVARELALEEGHVDQGGVEVDELEDEHFERQVVVKFRLGAMHLPGGESEGQSLINLAHRHDRHQIDHCTSCAGQNGSHGSGGIV